MHPQNRKVGQHLACEVSIRDGIHAVRRDFRESQLGGHGLAIQKDRRSGNRPRAQRAGVHARGCVGQARGIAVEHLNIGQEVMCKKDRLGALEVGVAGNDRVLVAFGEADE